MGEKRARRRFSREFKLEAARQVVGAGRTQKIATASVTVNPQESVSEDPALQKVPELSLDEARRRAIAVAGPGEKGLELLGDDLAKGSLLWPARSVGGRGGCLRE
jgi:hypothetical protein